MNRHRNSNSLKMSLKQPERAENSCNGLKSAVYKFKSQKCMKNSQIPLDILKLLQETPQCVIHFENENFNILSHFSNLLLKKYQS